MYRFLVALVRLAVRSRRSKDLEIIVLRHQFAVLRRQNNRPALADEDPALLGAIEGVVNDSLHDALTVASHVSLSVWATVQSRAET